MAREQSAHLVQSQLRPSTPRQLQRTFEALVTFHRVQELRLKPEGLPTALQQLQTPSQHPHVQHLLRSPEYGCLTVEHLCTDGKSTGFGLAWEQQRVLDGFAQLWSKRMTIESP